MFTSFSSKQITWVAIGDSVTWLNGQADETYERITKGCMERAVEKLPTIYYINHGYNGWTSGDIAKDIDTPGFQKTGVYSIFPGTNDWSQGRYRCCVIEL